MDTPCCPPRFSGVDVIRWTVDVQRYFDFFESPDKYRFLLVGCLIDHPAYEWFCNYRRINPDCLWQNFLDDIIQKFDPTTILITEILGKLRLWADSSKKKLCTSNSTYTELAEETVVKETLEPVIEPVLTKDAPVIEPMSTKDAPLIEPLLTEDEKHVVEEEDEEHDVSDDGVTLDSMPYFPLPCVDSVLLQPVIRSSLLTTNFFDLHLEDKVYFNRGGVDTDIHIYFIPEGS